MVIMMDGGFAFVWEQFSKSKVGQIRINTSLYTRNVYMFGRNSVDVSSVKSTFPFRPKNERQNMWDTKKMLVQSLKNSDEQVHIMMQVDTITLKDLHVDMWESAELWFDDKLIVDFKKDKMNTITDQLSVHRFAWSNTYATLKLVTSKQFICDYKLSLYNETTEIMVEHGLPLDVCRTILGYVYK